MPPRIEGINKYELRDLHVNAKMCPRELAEFYGVDRVTILNRMKEYEIKTRSKSEARRNASSINGSYRKYQINEDFFKSWTPESAWLYGWAIGDGVYIYGLRFNLARIDKEVLFKFRSVLESEHPVKDYKIWSKKYQKWYFQSKIDFYSVELLEDLKQLNYYDVPLEHFSHFVRGFFEAEGCIYWNKNKRIRRGGTIESSFSQNDRNILDYIHTVLQETGIVRGGGIAKNKDGRQLIFSINDTFALYDYIYDSNCGTNFLERKKEKFEELIERHN